MDGFKKRLSESVQLKLSRALSLAFLVVGLVAGTFSFMTAFDEANELQDDVLKQVAQLMDRQRLSSTPPATAEPVKPGDEEVRVIVQPLGAAPSAALGVPVGEQLPLPAQLSEGMHTLDVAGERFRVLVRTTAAGERFAVAQELSFRNAIAREGALRTVMPLLILVPVLLLHRRPAPWPIWCPRCSAPSPRCRRRSINAPSRRCTPSRIASSPSR